MGYIHYGSVILQKNVPIGTERRTAIKKETNASE